MADNEKRLRRARRTRAKIRELSVDRLTIYRTPRHIYAQIIDPTGGNVVASAQVTRTQLLLSARRSQSVQNQPVSTRLLLIVQVLNITGVYRRLPMLRVKRAYSFNYCFGAISRQDLI